MTKIFRKVVGGESWEIKDPIAREDGIWQQWDQIEDESVSAAGGALVAFIDIHERDGDPPSVWRAERDGQLLEEIDARLMEPKERLLPDDLAEEGREILGEMIKPNVDEVLGAIEGLMKRPKIAEFQSRLRGLILGHATRGESISQILERGLTQPYNYACVEEGWVNDELTHNVQFRADDVASRTYPDPEGQWGDHGRVSPYSLAGLVDLIGMEAVLDELEQHFDGELRNDWSDPTDPKHYNLVVVGVVPPEAIIKETK